MTTKRCTKCHVVKQLTDFSNVDRGKYGKNSKCKKCNQLYAEKKTERGLKILKELASSQRCCQHCSRLYTNEDWHFFEFDHINPNLKLFKNEAEARWIDGHRDEFYTRVAPNLQLLCVKCHKIKTSEEIKLGGSVHKKIHGQSQSAEVIEPDLTLFDLSTLN